MQILASKSDKYDDRMGESKIYVFKNYVFLQKNPKSHSLRVYNVSEINFETGEFGNFDIEIHQRRLSNDSFFKFYFTRNNFNSFFIVVQEGNNEGKNEISTYEILIPSKKNSDFLANVRMPL